MRFGVFFGLVQMPSRPLAAIHMSCWMPRRGPPNRTLIISVEFSKCERRQQGRGCCGAAEDMYSKCLDELTASSNLALIVEAPKKVALSVSPP